MIVVNLVGIFAAIKEHVGLMITFCVLSFFFSGLITFILAIIFTLEIRRTQAVRY